LLSDCILADLKISIRIIDNGSSPAEVATLKTLKHPVVEVHFNAINTGFTGGQNSNIHHALEQGFDFVWMLNNDTSVPPGTIDRMLKCFSQDERCGAVSPRIVRMGDPGTVDFCGAVHDWAVIDTIRPASLAEAPLFLHEHESHIWAVGTALMLRTSTIRDIGPLDDRLFAYYDDDDLGARLIAAGWRTRIALDAHVEHACFEGDMYRRAPYFFYLMTRNALLFALAHTPSEHRRLLRSRFIDRSLYRAEKLLKQGQKEKADACLLGLADGLTGRGGPPNLMRKVPLWLRGLQPIGRLWNQSRVRA
jgi:GT2 family glycosyltransferase